MGRIGRSYSRDQLTDTNSASAYRRFGRSTTDAEDRRIRQEVALAIVGLLLVLAFIGWALTL